MNRIKQWTSNSPVTFSLAITLIFIAMLVIIAMVASRWLPESSGWFLTSAIGRLASVLVLMALLYGLGWMQSTGLTQPGRWPAWLAAVLLLSYMTAASTYAFSGRLDLSFLGQPLPGVTALFILAHALLEEVTFRGLVLIALVRVWGGTERGLVKSVIVSSLLFAGMHVINVAGGNPLPVVLLQSVGAVFLGILFCGLVLSGGSLHPIVLLHGVANLAGYLILSAHPSAGGDPSGWLLQSLLMIPLALIGLAILRAMPRRSRIPTTALSMTTVGGKR